MCTHSGVHCDDMEQTHFYLRKMRKNNAFQLTSTLNQLQILNLTVAPALTAGRCLWFLWGHLSRVKKYRPRWYGENKHKTWQTSRDAGFRPGISAQRTGSRRPPWRLSQSVCNYCNISSALALTRCHNMRWIMGCRVVLFWKLVHIVQAKPIITWRKHSFFDRPQQQRLLKQNENARCGPWVRTILLFYHFSHSLHTLCACPHACISIHVHSYPFHFHIHIQVDMQIHIHTQIHIHMIIRQS